MSDVTLELQNGPVREARGGRWRGFVLPVLALAIWWFVSRDAKPGHGIMMSPARAAYRHRTGAQRDAGARIERVARA